MTKEEYQDFILRYKGCGACFPMYHTLSRFEKMWFTAIQKDVEDLEKENAELKDDNKVMADNYSKMEQKFYGNLTKAKELIEDMYDKIPASHSDYYKDVMDRARQFLSEVEK